MDRFSDSRIEDSPPSRQTPPIGLAALLPALLVTLWGASLAADAEDSLSWIVKEPAAWTLQDAEEILWSSPWVQERRFRFFNARHAIRQITYYVRLQSARPVRLALAKAFLSQPDNFVVTVKRTDPGRMQELSEEFRLPGELVVSLIMSPQFIHERLNEQVYETLKKSSYLQYEGRKIGLKDFVPPSKTTFGEAWFRFPRPEVTSSSRKLRFVTVLEVPYRVSVKVEFDTHRLVFLGKLEY